MQILGNIFNAIIFVSVVGSLFTVISLFVNLILHCTLPLWFSLCGMILNGFRIAGFLWVCGCGVFLVCDLMRLILAKQAIKSYRICDNERLNTVYSQCAAAITLKKAPVLYCGTLHDPVCVTGVIRPAVIMNEPIIEKLTDKELSAVFFHELTHVKRKHILLERIYDYVCILNWMNPFSWIARKNFSLHCETDCDTNSIKMLQGKVTNAEYASAIIRLSELSAVRGAKSRNGTGALDFLLTKRRIKRITAGTSKRRKKTTAVFLAVLLAVILAFSMRLSREYFYPYPANNTGIEYSAGYNQ